LWTISDHPSMHDPSPGMDSEHGVYTQKETLEMLTLSMLVGGLD